MADLGTGVASVWSAGGAADVDPFFRRVSGNLAVAHSIARRLITERGTLSWAPGVGFDVRALINEALAGSSQAVTSMIATYVREEALGDERVSDAEVDVSFNASTHSLRISMRVTTAEGPFRLVLGADALTLSILSIEV